MTSHVFRPMAAAEPDVEHILAVRGTGGYRQYRIPALTALRAELLPALLGLPVLPAKLGNAAAMVGAARLVLTAPS